MKLSHVFATLTGGKAKVLSTLGGLAIAGAACFAAAPAAQAQVSFGVEIGSPRYYAPAPRPVYVAPRYAGYGYTSGYAPGYWDHHRDDAWRAREFRDRGFNGWHRDNEHRYDTRQFENHSWR